MLTKEQLNQNDVYYIKKHHSRNPGNKGITKMDMVYLKFYLTFWYLSIFLFVYFTIVSYI